MEPRTPSATDDMAVAGASTSPQKEKKRMARMGMANGMTRSRTALAGAFCSTSSLAYIIFFRWHFP